MNTHAWRDWHFIGVVTFNTYSIYSELRIVFGERGTLEFLI